MRAQSFIRRFWAISAIVAAACLIFLHLFGSSSNDPAPPPLPVPGKSYVSQYGDGGGEVDHFLFRFGLFGFSHQFGRANVLLIGSSHPQLGLSAAQIEKFLRERSNRQIKVFNIAMGFSESAAFAQEVIAHHPTNAVMAIVDAFSPIGGKISRFGLTVLRQGRVQAYRQVVQIWTDFLGDWISDRIIPRVRFRNGGFSVERALKPVILRDWKNGDTIDVWTPDMGSKFQSPPPALPRPFRAAPQLPAQMGIPNGFVDALSKRGIRSIATLVPYPGGDPETAAARAAQAGIPFVEIPAEGLLYYDGVHLTAAGRELATHRLLDGLDRKLDLR